MILENSQILKSLLCWERMVFIYLFVTGQPIICVTVSPPRKTFDIVAQPKGKIISSCSNAVSTLCAITVATIASVVFVVIITQLTL